MLYLGTGRRVAAADRRRGQPAAAARRRAVRGAARHVVELRRPVRARRSPTSPSSGTPSRRAVRRRRRLRRRPAGGPAAAAGAAQGPRSGAVSRLDPRMLDVRRRRTAGACSPPIKRDGRPQLSNVGYAYDPDAAAVPGLGDRRPRQDPQPRARPPGHAARRLEGLLDVGRRRGHRRPHPRRRRPGRRHGRGTRHLLPRRSTASTPTGTSTAPRWSADRRLVVRFRPEHTYGQLRASRAGAPQLRLRRPAGSASPRTARPTGPRRWRTARTGCPSPAS